MLCLCNPHNPLGKLYSVAELRKILDIANAHGLYILNDEVWSDIIYSEVPFHSLMEFPKEDTQHVMTVYGFSKGFSMAGIRGGYLICPEKALFDRAFDVSGVGVTVGGVPCLTQVAMKAAFEKGFPWVDAFVAHLQTCRDMAYDRLNAMPGIHADKQEATFVTFFDMRESAATTSRATFWSAAACTSCPAISSGLGRARRGMSDCATQPATPFCRKGLTASNAAFRN